MDAARHKLLRVLIVDDSAHDAELVLRYLRGAGFAPEWRRIETEADFIAHANGGWDVILVDYHLPHFSGSRALQLAQELGIATPILLVSGTIGEETAIETMKQGARDFLLKDRLARLGPAIEHALATAAMHEEKVRADAALRASEERFRSFMRHLPGRASIRDREGRYLYVNDTWLREFGKDAAAVLGRTYEEIWPKERAATLARAHHQVIATNEPVSRTFRTGSDHNPRWWLSTHFPIRDAHGNAAMVGTIGIDITERRGQEEKIARLNRVYAVLSGINSLIVRVRDRTELFNEACRIAVEKGQFGIAWIGTFDPASFAVTPVAWAGVDTEDLTIVSTYKSTTRPDVPEGQGALGRAIREKRPVFSNDIAAEPGVGGKRREAALRRGYHSVIVLPLVVEGEVTGMLSLCAKETGFFTDSEVTLLTELAGDISFALEHIGKEEKLNYLAYYDALTGLPNRALFHERLSHQLRLAERNGTKVALILADVKRFRYVNESLGRRAGDALLREMADRARKAWSDPDNVARITADCFAGFVIDVSDEAMMVHLLEKVVKADLAMPFRFDDKELAITVTAGAAIFPTDGGDADALLGNAEAALKQAKKSGERYVFYQPAMNAAAAQTLLLESRLRRALERRQFVLHYQPKIDLASGTVSGVEALIRWQDPEIGLVPRGQFIPLLEETGIIHEVGNWVIEQTLTDYRGWYVQGLQPPRIAVNVSPIQLRQKNFVAGVRDAIKTLSAGSHGLDMEITESLIMQDIEANIEKLRALKNMGVNIAIDDFGTGYSSLGYLAKLPVNALKIDRSFVVTMATSPDSMTIVSTIISLAHSLKLKVIGEGVETEEQRKVLRLLKCDEIQGYLVGEPLPAEELAGVLRTRK